MKNLGPLKYFIGIEVIPSSEEIYLCQKKYALDIIKECCLWDVNRLQLQLMEFIHKISVEGDDYFNNPEGYQ